MDPDEIAIGTATEDDREFSYQVKKAAEGDYIKTIWDWDEDKQRKFHTKNWQEKRPDIIVYEGNRIGTVYIRQEEGIFHIRQFFILPEYQNRGLGTEILRRAQSASMAARNASGVSPA